jgi:hypothetical protein
MKKLVSSAKVALFGATLFATSIGFMPKAAEAWVLTIYCSGGSSHCATVETDDYIFDFYFGSFQGFEFEPYASL